MNPTASTTVAEIRKARAHDAPRIASTLARAFFDDPVFRWAYPDDARRREVLPGIFSVFTEAFQRHDEIYLAGQGAGVALWAPPGQAPVDDEHADEFNQRLEQAAGADADRFFELAGLIDDHHPHGSYYYLQLLGVEPEQPGARHRLDPAGGHDRALRPRRPARLPRRHQPRQQAAIRAARLPRQRRVRSRWRPAAMADVARPDA